MVWIVRVIMFYSILMCVCVFIWQGYSFYLPKSLSLIAYLMSIPWKNTMFFFIYKDCIFKVLWVKFVFLSSHRWFNSPGGLISHFLLHFSLSLIYSISLWGSNMIVFFVLTRRVRERRFHSGWSWWRRGHGRKWWWETKEKKEEVVNSVCCHDVPYVSK